MSDVPASAHEPRSTASPPPAPTTPIAASRPPIAAPPRTAAPVIHTAPPQPTAELRKLPDTAPLGEKWAALMDAARDNRRLRVLLIDVMPLSWSAGTLTVRPATPVLALSIDAARAEIGHLANLVVPGTTSVILERDDTPQQAATPASNLPTAAEMSEHPLIKQAIELFGGKVTFVQARKPAPEK
ncbi:MAG TPA: hypothetical protein VK157_00615 [Phycisphaerales bacterium]|nr:hypothetical protein [Phycisphaerales bacterium]